MTHHRDMNCILLLDFDGVMHSEPWLGTNQPFLPADDRGGVASTSASGNRDQLHLAIRPYGPFNVLCRLQFASASVANMRHTRNDTLPDRASSVTVAPRRFGRGLKLPRQDGSLSPFYSPTRRTACKTNQPPCGLGQRWQGFSLKHLPPFLAHHDALRNAAWRSRARVCPGPVSTFLNLDFYGQFCQTPVGPRLRGRV